MTRHYALVELRDFIDLLNDSDLAIYSNSVIQAPNKLNDTNVLSITTARHTGPHAGAIGLAQADEPDFFFSPDNYIASFRAGDYAVALSDGALLQVRYDF